MKFHSNKTRFTTLSMPLPHCAVTTTRLHSPFLILLIDQLFQDENSMKKLKFGDSLFLFIFLEQRVELELVEKQQQSIGERTQNIHKQFNFTVFFFFFSSCAHPRENVTWTFFYNCLPLSTSRGFLRMWKLTRNVYEIIYYFVVW